MRRSRVRSFCISATTLWLGATSIGCSDGGRGASSAFADEYSARRLSFGAPRIAIYKRSYARDVCAWIVVVEGPNVNQQFTAPDGWMVESGSLDRGRDDCFTANPLAPGPWPADGTGAVGFAYALSADRPCAIDVHGGLVAYSSVNGEPRPDLMSDNERLDADALVIQDGCPP